MRSRKSLPPLPPEQACLPWHPPGLVAGVDEAGRGPLAGPVVAAAVILDDLNPIEGLNDSKKLTAARREALYDEIRAKALCCSIAEASVEEIDRLNILQATLLAMRRAVLGLRLKPVMVASLLKWMRKTAGLIGSCAYALRDIGAPPGPAARRAPVA